MAEEPPLVYARHALLRLPPDLGAFGFGPVRLPENLTRVVFAFAMLHLSGCGRVLRHFFLTRILLDSDRFRLLRARCFPLGTFTAAVSPAVVVIGPPVSVGSP